jgi:hypothetical protein
MNNSTGDDNNYLIHEDINRPAYATAFIIELILGFTANTTILVLTLVDHKSLRNPSVLFLTALIIANLIMCVFFMPFTIISIIAGGWIFVAEDEYKLMFCQFVGFIFAFCCGLNIHLLALISFDRFLFIVKPLLYRKYMTIKVAIPTIIILYITIAVGSTTPFYGLGQYEYSGYVSSCVPRWLNNNTDYVIYMTGGNIVPFVVIGITTVWTILHTHLFLRRRHKDNMITTAKLQAFEKSIYHHKVCNLFGMFGILLTTQIICFIPYNVVILVGFIIGFDNIPVAIYNAAMIITFINIISTPVTQAYFRSNIRQKLFKMFQICRKQTKQQKIPIATTTTTIS